MAEQKQFLGFGWKKLLVIAGVAIAAVAGFTWAMKKYAESKSTTTGA